LSEREALHTGFRLQRGSQALVGDVLHTMAMLGGLGAYRTFVCLIAPVGSSEALLQSFCAGMKWTKYCHFAVLSKTLSLRGWTKTPPTFPSWVVLWHVQGTRQTSLLRVNIFRASG
jgi:hypothetical protein